MLTYTATGFVAVGPLAFDPLKVQVDGRDVCELIRKARDEHDVETPGGDSRRFPFARVTLELLETLEDA